MYIQKTAHYILNEEEKKALHIMSNILNNLSDGIVYGRDDHYVANDYHIGEEDICQVKNLIAALITAEELTIEENMMVAD